MEEAKGRADATAREEAARGRELEELGAAFSGKMEAVRANLQAHDAARQPLEAALGARLKVLKPLKSLTPLKP